MNILNTTYKIIVAGSRHFNDYLLLKSVLDRVFRNTDSQYITIISGGCTGADLLGERYAKENGMEIIQFLPDWSKGKKAGPMRNRDMGKVADKCICFYDGTSRGTRSMINICKELNIDCLIVNYISGTIETIKGEW